MISKGWVTGGLGEEEGEEISGEEERKKGMKKEDFSICPDL